MELRKSEKANIEHKVPMFFMIGLNVALLLTIVAFEWKTPYQYLIEDFDDKDIIYLEETVQITRHIPPPPPKPIVPLTPIEVEHDPPNQSTEIPEVDPTPDTPHTGDPSLDFVEGTIEVVDEPILNPDDLEVHAEFPGGHQAMAKFIQKTMKKPRGPIGLEGVIYLKFVVEKDGSVGHVEVMKGISPTLDEEAKRVVKLMKFNPGKQRGREVRQWMLLPLSIKSQ
jgi:periplasmic protein TonB